MLLKTRHFGEINIGTEDILSFEEGILGFEHIKKYALIDDKDKDNPFKWLQGIEDSDVAFVVINPFSIKRDYDIKLDQRIINMLDIEKEEDVLIFSIVVVPEDITKISMNLKAPLIINTARKKGVQLVLDTDAYNVRHYILEELRTWEVTGNACPDKEEGSDDYNKR